MCKVLFCTQTCHVVSHVDIPLFYTRDLRMQTLAQIVISVIYNLSIYLLITKDQPNLSFKIHVTSKLNGRSHLIQLYLIILKVTFLYGIQIFSFLSLYECLPTYNCYI